MAASSIDTVDFGSFRQGTNQERKTTAQQINHAFQDLGFVALKNHGIPAADVNNAFEWSEKFFALPNEIKALGPHPPGHAHHRGWSSMGSEKLSQHIYDKDELEQLKNVPEIKETFESGNTNDDMQPNIWPSEQHIPGFRAHMETFFEKCAELLDQVLRALAVALDLDNEDDLSSKHSRQLYQLRLAFYPSVAADVLRSGAKDRCAAHSDFGTITLLFQDANGGLEVENPKQSGTFVPATPVPDTVIVNCGDIMERWSNGRWRSGVHRVVAPPVDANKTEVAGEKILKSRYSIPFFAAPNPDALIEPLPGCWDDQRPKMFDPITVNDYIMMRMATIR